MAARVLWRDWIHPVDQVLIKWVALSPMVSSFLSIFGTWLIQVNEDYSTIPLSIVETFLVSLGGSEIDHQISVNFWWKWKLSSIFMVQMLFQRINYCRNNWPEVHCQWTYPFQTLYKREVVDTAIGDLQAEANYPWGILAAITWAGLTDFEQSQLFSLVRNVTVCTEQFAPDPHLLPFCHAPLTAHLVKYYLDIKGIHSYITSRM